MILVSSTSWYKYFGNIVCFCLRFSEHKHALTLNPTPTILYRDRCLLFTLLAVDVGPPPKAN